VAKLPAIGAYCRPLAELDGRTREATLMRRVRAELTAHCGGALNAVQRALIERAAILSIRVAQVDAKIIAGEALMLHVSNFALAWNKALRRTVAALSLEHGAAKPSDPMALSGATCPRARPPRSSPLDHDHQFRFTLWPSIERTNHTTQPAVFSLGTLGMPCLMKP
jgi:hypothetical protein